MVIGSNGFQGAAVARALKAGGHEVRGFTRGNGATNRKTRDLATRHGDLADPDAVREAFDGVTHASVVLPLVFDAETIEAYANNIVTAARAAGVKRLVYNTNTPVPEPTTRHAAYETRRVAERVFLAGDPPAVVLRPPVYLDNLFSPWNGPDLVNNGVLAYPFSADRRVSWLSHDDLAAATVAALHAEGVENTVLPLGGPEAISGDELAAVLAGELGGNVTFRPLTASGFESMLRGPLGATTAAGIAGIYRWLDDDPGSELFHVDNGPAERLLGFEPAPIADWVRAQPWEVWKHTSTG
nr:NmrA family NAD(P)-binding protein [Actinopolyspora biskrensis]